MNYWVRGCPLGLLSTALCNLYPYLIFSLPISHLVLSELCIHTIYNISNILYVFYVLYMYVCVYKSCVIYDLKLLKWRFLGSFFLSILITINVKWLFLHLQVVLHISEVFNRCAYFCNFKLLWRNHIFINSMRKNEKKNGTGISLFPIQLTLPPLRKPSWFLDSLNPSCY